MANTHRILKGFLAACLVFTIILMGCFLCPYSKHLPTLSRSLTPNQEALVIQQQYTKQLTQTILNLLTPLVGQNKVRVAIQLNLSLQNVQKTMHANMAESIPIFTNSETFEKSIQNLIQQQHISIVIDGNRQTDKKGIYQPYSVTEMDKFKHLVQNAVGLDTARGDTLDIQNMPFVTADTIHFTSYTSLYCLGFLVLCFIVLLFLFLCPYHTTEKYLSSVKSADLNQVAQKITQNPSRFQTVLKNWIYLPPNKNSDWTPIQKAGIILLSLDEDIVRQTLVSLDDEEVRLLSKAMATLGVIPPQESLRVLNELSLAMDKGSVVVGNTERVHQLFSENLTQPLWPSSLTNPHSSLWKELAQTKTDLLIPRFNQLRPENIAYILYHLPTQKATEIISLLPQKQAAQTLIHLHHIGHITDTTQTKMDQETISIVQQILDTLTIKTGAEKANDIMDVLSQQNKGEQILSTLSQTDTSLAQLMISRLIKFDDFAKWPSDTIQTILRHVPRSIALTALINANPAVVGAISRNIPESVWLSLARDIESKKNTSQQTIETARQKILAIVQELIHQQKIQL